MKYKENNYLKISSCSYEAPINLEKYLLSFLSPTSPNTNYWDSPREANLKGLSEREISRIVKQACEINSIIEKHFSKTKNINFLDVGTGNGMVPKFLNVINNQISSTAIDPFLHGGHKTSWQDSESKGNISRCIKHFKNNDGTNFHESSDDYMLRYIEKKLYLEEYIKKSSIKHDCVYCKAIEHVPNWEDFANQICSVVNDEGIIIFKHRSFFSYLGPHRYSSTAIPWGHCLMSNDEYVKYSRTYHENRHEDMCNFFFTGLSFPRMSLRELIQVCTKKELTLESLFIEKPRYHKLQDKVVNEHPVLIDKILEINKNLSYEEITSGLITLVFKKN